MHGNDSSQGPKKTSLNQPKAAVQLDDLEREEKEEEKEGFEGQQLFIIFFFFQFSYLLPTSIICKILS